MMKIRVVCATRLSAADFWDGTVTGRSLERLHKLQRDYDIRLFANNERSLGQCYDDAIKEAKTDPAILVFMHDDVLILDYFWRETVSRLLNRFDVIGLAGSTYRLPQQSAWHNGDPAEVSGVVGHGLTFPPAKLDVYGPPEQEVMLLDGFFIAADSGVLNAKNVSFDPRFDFHFYDLDFCRQCERAGLRMGTAPISVVHQETSADDKDSRLANHTRYIAKWHDDEPAVSNHGFMKLMHEDLAPQGYVEIGICNGVSLALAMCESVGIDPMPKVSVPLGPKTVVVAATSDDFFNDWTRSKRILPPNIDLAYIDGMHLAEFALRDFMSIEARANRRTVVCFDDVLPSNREIAVRTQPQARMDWAGDVWKLVEVFKVFRPDLRMMLVNTSPSGTLVVYGLNPDNTRFRSAYTNILYSLAIETELQLPPANIIDRDEAVSVEHARNVLREWLAGVKQFEEMVGP